MSDWSICHVTKGTLFLIWTTWPRSPVPDWSKSVTWPHLARLNYAKSWCFRKQRICTLHCVQHEPGHCRTPNRSVQRDSNVHSVLYTRHQNRFFLPQVGCARCAARSAPRARACACRRWQSSSLDSRRSSCRAARWARAPGQTPGREWRILKGQWVELLHVVLEDVKETVRWAVGKRGKIAQCTN